MQKWMSSFRHMKIKNKISILFGLIIVVTFTFTLLVQQYAFSIYDKQLYDKSSQVLNLSSAAIETKLGRIEQMSYEIIADIRLQNVLLSIKNNESDYELHLLRQDVIDRPAVLYGIRNLHLFDTAYRFAWQGEWGG